MEEKEKTQSSNLGNEIQSIVQSAMAQGDFKNLNKEITKTVNTAIHQVNEGLGQVQNRTQQEIDKTKMSYQNGAYSQYTGAKRKIQNYNTVKGMKPAVARREVHPLVSSRPAGKVSNVVATTFGAMGTIGFGITESVLGILCAAGMNTGLAFWIIFPFLLGSIGLLAMGSSIRKRLKRYQQYVHRLHGRNFCELQELASAVDKDVKFVAKDVRKMIDLNMFPQGQLSDKKDYLLLDHESFQQYNQAQLERKKREEEEAKEKRQKESNPYFSEMKEAVTSGNEYIRQIQEANRDIPGEVISKKLDDLEEVIRKIFTELEKNPDKIGEMKKFMDYYLPTSIKLVNAYREFDKYTVETDNIKKSKIEIEDTIDTITKAFYKLFDSLFDDKAMDIATDISVLNTMLAQEGLKESDFSLK